VTNMTEPRRTLLFSFAVRSWFQVFALHLVDYFASEKFSVFSLMTRTPHPDPAFLNNPWKQNKQVNYMAECTEFR